MKEKLKLMGFVAVVIFSAIFIMASNANALTKGDVTVELLENTDICDNDCHSKYNVCFSGLTVIGDMDFKYRTLNDPELTSDYSKALEEEPDILIKSVMSCYEIDIYGKKGIFESVDNVPCFKDICFNEFAWWSRNFNCRTEINFTRPLETGQVFSVNDNLGLDDDFLWTNKASEKMYVYYEFLDCTGNKAIGNETNQLNWENSESGAGNNPEFVWAIEYKGVWHLDGIGTVARDSTSNHENGTIDLRTTKGIYDGGLITTYNQYTGNVTIPSSASLQFNQNLTACAWVNVTDYATSGAKTHVSKSNLGAWPTIEWYIRTNGFNNDLECVYRKNGLDESYKRNAGGVMIDNTYQHICCVIDPTGEITIYVNGTDVGGTPTGTKSVTWNTGTHNLLFGAEGRGSSDGSGGTMDEVYVINETKDAQWVKDIYDSGINNLTFLGINDTIPPENTSLLMYSFDIDSFVISSTTQTPFINVSFPTTDPILGVGVLFSANCERLTGLTNKVTAEVIYDGVLADTRQVCSVNSAGDITSGGMLPDGLVSFPGEHNIQINFNISQSGSVNISNIDMNLLQTKSAHGIPFNASKRDMFFSFSNTDFQIVANYSAVNITNGSQQFFWFQFSASGTGEDVIYVYVKNEDSGFTFPFTAGYIADSNDLRSMSLVFFDGSQETFSDPTNYSIYAKTRNGETINIDGIFRTGNIRDLVGNLGNSFFVTNESTNLTNFITLGEGTHLLTSKNVTVYNGTDLYLNVHVSINSSSGTQTPTMFINSTETGRCTQKQRYLSANIDHASIFAYFLCNNLTINESEVYSLYLTVDAGETVNLLDEAMSGAEASIFNLTFENLAPIPNIILNPANNSIVFGDNENITWLPFFDPNFDVITYNISLFFKNGSFAFTINDTITETITPVNWSTITNEDYDLMVEGCDPASLCSNTTINITVIETPTCNVTFNIKDAQFLVDITGVSVICGSPFNFTGDSPISELFIFGNYDCLIIKQEYFNETQSFSCVGVDLEFDIFMERIIPITPLNITLTFELSDMTVTEFSCADNNTLKKTYKSEVGTSFAKDNMTRTELEICQWGCDIVNKRCRDSPLTSVISFSFLVIIIISSILVPLFIVSRRFRDKTMKFLIDMITFLASMIIYIVLISFALIPTVSMFGQEYVTLSITIIYILIVSLLLMVGLIARNVIKRRYN